MRKLFIILASVNSPGSMTVAHVGNTITITDNTTVPGNSQSPTGLISCIATKNVVRVEAMFQVRKGGGSAGGGQGGSALNSGPLAAVGIVTQCGTTIVNLAQVTGHATWTDDLAGANVAAAEIASWL